MWEKPQRPYVFEEVVMSVFLLSHPSTRNVPMKQGKRLRNNHRNLYKRTRSMLILRVYGFSDVDF